MSLEVLLYEGLSRDRRAGAETNLVIEALA